MNNAHQLSSFIKKLRCRAILSCFEKKDLIAIRKFHLTSCHFKPTSSITEQIQVSNIDLANFPVELIRNFSIIAHVDHGKSTLADRILELTGAIKKNVENKQVLDTLQVEKERGITVKAQTASIVYKYKGQEYLLNLIDTPGHVDFAFEVSRSLAACQGVILLIDANQGVQAQTVANFYLAFTNELEIIAVLNKIDLKNAQPEEVKKQLKNLFDINSEQVLSISAKFGTGVPELLEAIIKQIPSPASSCDPKCSLRALLFDSHFDRYKGVVCLIQVVDGTMKLGDLITSFQSGKSYEVKELGILTPQITSVKKLYTGQVGFFSANIRQTKEAQVGDTFFLKGENCKPLPGFMRAKPMVFAGLYPMDQSDHTTLSAALDRLMLNDSSVSITKESSAALGQGWRLGFLGLLHMDVFNQRLEQEHGAQVVITTPSVPYKVRLRGEKVIKEYGGEEVILNNPSHWPEPYETVETLEPIVKGIIITPDTYLGPIVGLCQQRRGIQIGMHNLDLNRIIIQYKLPLNEIVVDFYDALKSITSGYATFDYEEMGFEESNVVKLNIMLNGNFVEELATIVHISRARSLGKQMCLKLCETIPKQMFQIAIQAAVGGNVIARETIKAIRKDVLAKCYGGDISRKMKLLKRQSEGKKRMRMVGNIEVPRQTFIDILKR